MDAVVEWVDARERLPRDGMPVAAATSGRYPPDSEAEEPEERAGQHFWLVMPMHFTTHHISEDGTHHYNCFVDSDRIVRLPYGNSTTEPVTHWAELPTLPGRTEHYMAGDHARTAVENALG